MKIKFNATLKFNDDLNNLLKIYTFLKDNIIDLFNIELQDNKEPENTLTIFSIE